MARKSFLYLVLVSLILLSGCATVQKQNDLQVQGLKNQVTVLEAQLQEKNAEINSLTDKLNSVISEKELIASQSQFSKKKSAGESNYRCTVKNIQRALKNAGYNPGGIDGKSGKQTKDAIKAFQKANDLTVDGKVGKGTWALLKKYLYQKTK